MLKFSSLRTRLILAYVGLIILGFSGLAAIAGRQLSTAAREDFERQSTNEIELAARGLERTLEEYYRGDIEAEELDEVLEAFETQIDAEITLFLFDAPQENRLPDRVSPSSILDDEPPAHETPLPPELDNYPELQAAAKGDIKLFERDNEAGDRTIYSAAPLNSRIGALGYIRTAEPASNLYGQIYSRWLLLGTGVGIITLISLAASIYLSLTLIRPLKILRHAALELSHGHLSHRVPHMATDELDELASTFNTMADQLESMIEEQRAFASNASHELRTPLTSARLRTEALRRDSTLDDETRTLYIQELDDEMQRMGGLIEDLILLSRLDAGRAQIGTDQIAFVRLMESLHRSFESMAASKGIDFQLQLPTDTENLTIQASLNHMTILFRNLLENALKYTPSGGSVTWEVHEEGDQIISIIRDTGQGIDSESRTHLFERFFRGDKAHSRETPGTGLGLSLVKAIADAYNAQIDVQSPGNGQGTTATVHWNRIAN